MQTTFYLVRHGETEWNCRRQLQGRLDSPLTAAGLTQAEAISTALVDCRIDAIVSSPLGRALHTAQICQRQLGTSLSTDEALMERDFGEWQSHFFDDLHDQPYFQQVFLQVTDKAPPGGESGLACGERIDAALRSLAHQAPRRRLLVVTHGDAIRCFLARLSAEQGCDAYSQYGNGRIFTLTYDPVTQVFDWVASSESQHGKFD